MPWLAQKAWKEATSAGSMALALQPRGLRVKNWKVFAPMSTAVRAMAAYPFELER